MRPTSSFDRGEEIGVAPGVVLHGAFSENGRARESSIQGGPKTQCHNGRVRI